MLNPVYIFSLRHSHSPNSLLFRPPSVPSMSPSPQLSTTINILKIPVMRRGTRGSSTRIPSRRVNPLNNLNIRRSNSDIIPTCNPVLRARVAKPSRSRWQLRHRVISVCNAPQTIDIRDIRRQRQVAHARLAVGILAQR
jgi:hypothetical protein